LCGRRSEVVARKGDVSLSHMVSRKGPRTRGTILGEGLDVGNTVEKYCSK